METKKQIYIIAALFFLISTSTVVFLVYPALNNIKQASAQMQNMQNQILSLEAESVQVDAFKTDYKDYELNFEKAEKLFINKRDLVDFIKFLEESASDLKLKLDINLLPASQANDSENNIMFQMSLKGKFPDAVKFIEKLEFGPYLVNVENIRVQKLSVFESSVIDNSKSDNPKEVEVNFLISVLSN